jgi:hypothetical protein
VRSNFFASTADSIGNSRNTLRSRRRSSETRIFFARYTRGCVNNDSSDVRRGGFVFDRRVSDLDVEGMRAALLADQQQSALGGAPAALFSISPARDRCLRCWR